MNKIGIVTIGVVALCTFLIAMPAVSAVPTLHFVPQDISVPGGYGNSVNVEIRINLSADDTNFGYGQFGFSHDPLCGNITSRTINTDIMTGVNPDFSVWNTPLLVDDCWNYTMDWCTFDFWIPKNGPTDLLYGNFTIQCNSSEYCTNDLNFSHMLGCSQGWILMWEKDGVPIEVVSTVNGTFTCGTPAETYTISGYAKTEGDDPATRVNITNLNKPDAVDDRPADYIGADGFYNLTLDVTGEVDTNDVLQITACRVRADDYYESSCNVSNHTVVTAPGEETNVNLTLNHYCLDLLNFPFREVNTTVLEAHNGTGAATAQMNLDYMWWNESVDDEPPIKYNQSYLYDYGLAHNAGDNLEWFDTRGMWYTIQYLDPSPYSEYGYNFGLNHGTDYEDMLNRICHWVAYTVGSVGGHKDGHPYHVPGAVPAYGDYTNWMSIRGLHTNEDPAPSTWVTPENLEVYGFWVNDPYPASLGGIGENSYKTADEWNLTYYKPLETGDQWDGEYVAILEPPEGDLGDITIMHSKARFDGVITPMLAEEPMMMYGVKQLALEKVVKDDEMLKIVQAAIDGVNEELVPYDSEFASVFAKTVPGKPVLVTSDNGDYYVVPFNVPVEVRLPVKKMPVEIERPKISGLKKLERVRRVADKIELKPIPIELIRAEKTLAVVIVDATDGSFKEASWVENPAKYLPVSKVEAMKLALGEVLDELHVVAKKDARDLEVVKQRPTIELVYVDASPYYPDWKVTVNGKVFYVSQDGTVSN